MPTENLKLELDTKPLDGFFEGLAKRLMKPSKTTLDRILDRLEEHAIARHTGMAEIKGLKAAKNYGAAADKANDTLRREWEAAVQAVEQKNGELEKLQKENAVYDKMLTDLYLAANNPDLLSKNRTNKKDAFFSLTIVLQRVAKQRPVIVPF